MNSAWQVSGRPNRDGVAGIGIDTSTIVSASGMATGGRVVHHLRHQLPDPHNAVVLTGYQVPGNDLRAVVMATREALERARAGQGPTLLECKTYRWYGHSAMRPDTRAYRAREEELEWRERDPVALAERELGKAGILPAERVAQVQREIATEIQDAVEFAERSPDPDVREIFTDVYAPY